MVTESKLQSRVFQPHSETIDEYYSSILSLGATLGHNSEQLATNFMNGLPKSIKDFVIGTDNHTMENYLSQARLYLARHPSGAKTVRFENQFPTTEVAAGADIVNAIAQGFRQLKVHMPSHVRGRGWARGYGRAQYGRSNSPYRGRGYYRGAAPSPRGRGFSRGRGRGRSSRGRSRTPSPGRVNQNDRGGACYRCGDPDHWANECPQTGACYKWGDADHWANECPKWPQHDDDNNDIHDDDISNVNQAPKLTNTDNENGCDNDGDQMPKPANVNECDNDVKQLLDPPNIPPETHENINANAPHSPMFIKSRIRNNRQAAVLSILTDTGAKSNLISLSSLALLGNQQPKLRRAPIKLSGLSGANGSELNTLGIVSLFVKLGDAEHLLDFYVINNLCTTAIIGSHDLSKLKATIDCASNVIRFGDGPPIRLQDASVTVPIVAIMK